tara:strand:+ start:633 stop:977 length:345 start_codon:yes stop_codon:yes gene_type:complete
MDFKYIYKICTKSEWEEAKLKGKFNGSKKDLEDGYIHFSDKEQIEGTLKKFFKNQKNLILLKINALELDHLIYEQSSDGNMFPHLYSSLKVSNICNEYDITLNKDGSHLLPLLI